jgi:hypothetical protein
MAIAGYLGATLMASGDYRTPFVIMAVTSAISTLLFKQWFDTHSDPEGQAGINP